MSATTSRARALAAGVIAVAAVISLGGGRAWAYPQFQLSRDQTCTSCHVSPAGGGTLTENGLAVAESLSRYGTAPEFFYGKVPTPSWLILDGDLRGAGGVNAAPMARAVGFPMQADLGALATYGAFSLRVTGGLRPKQVDGGALTALASREHYVTWRQHPDDNAGLYVRLGKFMPVFGLRFAEHVDYTRRAGGTPLYGEVECLAVEYVDPGYEVHATAYYHDPFVDGVEKGNGAALYAEARVNDHAQVGVEARYNLVHDEESKTYAGATGKLYLDGPALLLQAEGIFVRQHVAAGGFANQLVGYLMASRSLGSSYLLDVGLGHFDANVAIRGLDRDALDVNLHWFTTSHVELLATARLEVIGQGSGGATGGYGLLQLHYRL